MITRLITDEDILAGRVRSPIVLDGETLLTPAARDRAHAKGLIIVEKGASTAGVAPASLPAEAGACCQTAATLEKLSDGMYLIRVEGGRVASCLAAAGPGSMTRARNL